MSTARNSPTPTIQFGQDCVSCGLCAKVCPMGVFLPASGPTRANRPIVGDTSVCITCGQCVAVCPKDAVIHSGLALDDFPRQGRAPSIDWKDFVAFTRQRRSIRSFTDKKVPPELIIKILDECTRYAPTGHNRQATEVIVLEGEAISRLRQEMNAVISQSHRYLRYVRWMSPVLDQHWRQLSSWDQTIRLGRDPSTRNAPLALLFMTNSTAKESDVDAAILSYQTLLSAEALGLKSCYFGALKNALPFSRRLRRTLDLPRSTRLVCGLLLGFTDIKFRRLVSRKTIPIQRVGGLQYR